MQLFQRSPYFMLYGATCLGLGLAACSASLIMAAPREAHGDGPRNQGTPHPHRRGNAQAGRDVFRFETFGDEGFWTDAARMPQGMMQAQLTPLQALEAGLQVDSEAIPSGLREDLTREMKTDLSPVNSPLLHDPQTTIKLVNANAIIGLVAKDSNGDGTIDIANGDKVGIACALCHTVTDNSVYSMPGKGSIGRRRDGLTPYGLNVGKLLATAANSRAFWPILQHNNGGKTIGRAPKGLTPNSTETQVDAYLSNPKYFPIGTFDDTPDGIGNSITIQPLFRQDLAGPYGSSGQNAVLDDFSNTAYTILFDPTTLTTAAGHKFLQGMAGGDGLKLANTYEKILKETGVTGYPFINAATGLKPGEARSPVGRRVDDQKLLDLNAYLDSLPPPPGLHTDRTAEARGRQLFRANCTQCHNVDQSKPVPANFILMKTIYPGYRPIVIATRKPPLSPIQNSPGTFDDKMIVVDASGRGDIRGNALPLLLDLARKPKFLHDASVTGLDSLLNPSRGSQAPHPFYFRQSSQRADMIAFLKGLEIDKR